MSQKKKPEWLRVAEALRQHRGGITRLDFQAPHVIDGGKPIINMPGRIFDLRGKGYVIENRDDPTGVDRYVLVGMPAVDTISSASPTSSAPAPTPAAAETPLSASAAVPPDRPRSAIFDEDWDEVA